MIAAYGPLVLVGEGAKYTSQCGCCPKLHRTCAGAHLEGSRRRASRGEGQSHRVHNFVNTVASSKHYTLHVLRQVPAVFAIAGAGPRAAVVVKEIKRISGC